MKIYHYNNVSDAYFELLYDLVNYPEYTSAPRGEAINEITNVAIKIEHPCNNTFVNIVRSSPIKYICAELVWYFSGSNTVEYISKYAKMWNNLKDADGTVNSAYGYLLFNSKNKYGYTQYHWALEALKRDKDTRQAFMHFNNESHQYSGNVDQVCTMYGIFNIRNNFLNFTVHMRSNDAVLGFMTDFTFFNILHQQMHRHLLQYYPDLEIGSYTHTANSMHLYEKNFDLVKRMLQEPFVHGSLPLLDCNLITENGDSIDISTIENSEFINYITSNI